MSTKAPLWKQVKLLGNTQNLQYKTASNQDFKNYIQERMNKISSDYSQLNKLPKTTNWDKFFQNETKMNKIISDYSKLPHSFPRTQQQEYDFWNNYRLDIQERLSDLAFEALGKTPLSHYPIEWGYNYKNKEGEHKDIKFKACHPKTLKNQIEGLINGGSDGMDDIYLDKSQFIWTALKKQWVPYKKPTKKSKKGQGNMFQQCNIIDNEFIFCPQSGQCLLDCFAQVHSLEPYMEQLEKLFKKCDVFRYNIPQSLISDISKIVNIPFNIYRVNEKKLRYPSNPEQIILCLINSHWVILKQPKNLQQCYLYAVNNIKWENKTIDDVSLETQQNKVTYHTCTDEEIYNNTYIFDLETYKKSFTNQMEEYAVGYASLTDINDSLTGQLEISDLNLLVQQFHGKDCIYKMLEDINRMNKRIKTTHIKNGKEKNIFKQRRIYLYAHNASHFDSYFFLDIPKLKVSKMIEKGGIMSMNIRCDEFKNVKFVVKDTFKFLSSSLAKLCKSFKLPQEYCKTEIPHNLITESNWFDYRDIWEPYLNLDVISLSLIWMEFIKKMRIVSPEINVQKYVSIAQLAKSVSCKDQILSSAKDPALRQFIQLANRGGRVIARNQQYKTKNMDQILKLHNVTNIEQLVDQVLDKKSLELIGDDYDIAFDATSLYPSAMALPHASYIDIDNLNKLTEEQCQTFDETQYKKFIIQVDLYAPEDLQFVPISVKTLSGNQFATGYIKNIVVNDVDLRECLRFGYAIQKVHMGVYSEPIEYQYMKDFVLKFFAKRLEVKEQDPVQGDLYKLILNSAYGKYGQKRMETEIKFTTQKEFEKEYDVYTEDVVEFNKLGNGQIYYKVKKDYSEKEELSANHIAGYILAYSKQIMNNFILTLGADKENIINYMDTDSLYINSKHFQKLAHIKDCLGGGKNDYGKSKMIIQAEYLGCKSKICYVLDSVSMKLIKKVTWKGIATYKFEEINQKLIDQVKQSQIEQQNDGEDACAYIDGIENWNRSKTEGIVIQSNQTKKLSINQYCQKYDLDVETGIYHFQHLPEF